MQFQRKLRIQTQENGEKPHYGPNLGPLVTNSDRENFGSKIWLRHSLDITVSIIMHNQKKLMIQSGEKLVTYGRTRVIS